MGAGIWPHSAPPACTVDTEPTEPNLYQPPAPVSLTEGEAHWLTAGRLVSSCPCLFSTGIVGTHCWPFLWVLGMRAQVLMLTQAVSQLPSSRGRLLLCVLFTVLKFVCEFQWSNPPIFLEVKSDCVALSPWNSIVNQADLEFREVLQPVYLRLGLKTCATTSGYFSLKKKKVLGVRVGVEMVSCNLCWLKHLVLLPPSPKYWNYSSVPPLLATNYFFVFLFYDLYVDGPLNY